MKRRAFLARLAGVATAALVGPTVLKALPAPSPAPPILVFHRDAFKFSMEALEDLPDMVPYRMDVLYGVGYFREPVACRVVE